MTLDIRSNDQLPANKLFSIAADTNAHDIPPQAFTWCM